jgi:hypothetical protein
VFVCCLVAVLVDVSAGVMVVVQHDCDRLECWEISKVSSYSNFQLLLSGYCETFIKKQYVTSKRAERDEERGIGTSTHTHKIAIML